MDVLLTQKRRFFGRINEGNWTPQKDYELPILKAITSLGYKARARIVLKYVHEIMKFNLKDADYEKLECGKIRWQDMFNWCSHELVTRGLIEKKQRGVWIITNEGIQELLKNYDSYVVNYGAATSNGMSCLDTFLLDLELIRRNVSSILHRNQEE